MNIRRDIVSKKTIMLVCAAGLSTSMLVQKMQEAVAKEGADIDVFATGTSKFDENINQKNIDVVLLGPQVRFMKKDFEKKLVGKSIPIDVVEMINYGTMNGEKVLQQAKDLMNGGK